MITKFVAKYVLPQLKAHAAALASAGSLFVSDLSSQAGGIQAITSNQWWAIAAAAGLSFGVVHTVANTVEADVAKVAPAVAPVVTAALAPVVGAVAAELPVVPSQDPAASA